MPELFGRAYRLTVGTTRIDASAGAGTGLRIAFCINRDEKRTPNNAEIRIYNLSRDHREALAKTETVSVLLEAGYVDDLGVIFQGDLRTARTHHEPPGRTYITTVTGGDGESAIRTARINRTFKAGTTVAEVLRGLGTAMGVGAGNVQAAAAALSGTLPRARTFSGLCADELEAFCRTQGLRWSIQDMALQVRTEGQPIVPGTGYLLRRDSGLIGQPEVELNAVVSKFSSNVATAKLGAKKAVGKVVSGTALLRPDLIPGVAFRVESEAFEGNLVCTQTVHRGDSEGAEWFVDWVGKPY